MKAQNEKKSKLFSWIFIKLNSLSAKSSIKGQWTFKNDSRSVPCWNLLWIKAHLMQNNIPSLYILELDSSVANSV